VANDDGIVEIMKRLYDNAVQAMPGGGIIEVSTEFSEKNIPYVYGMSDSKGYVLLRFCDTGVGIDKEKLPHIFEPFFSTWKIKMASLGLWFVYSLITRWDGFIEA